MLSYQVQKETNKTTQKGAKKLDLQRCQIQRKTMPHMTNNRCYPNVSHENEKEETTIYQYSRGLGAL